MFLKRDWKINSTENDSKTKRYSTIGPFWMSPQDTENTSTEKRDTAWHLTKSRCANWGRTNYTPWGLNSFNFFSLVVKRHPQHRLSVYVKRSIKKSVGMGGTARHPSTFVWKDLPGSQELHLNNVTLLDRTIRRQIRPFKGWFILGHMVRRDPIHSLDPASLLKRLGSSFCSPETN